MKHTNVKNLLAILFVALLGTGVVSCKKEHADEETVKKEFFRFMRLEYANPKEDLEIESVQCDSLCLKQQLKSVSFPAEIKKLKKILENNLAEDAEFTEGRAEDEQNCFDAIKQLEKYDTDKVNEYELAKCKAMGYSDSMLNGWRHVVYYRDINSDKYNQFAIIESEDGEFTAPNLFNNTVSLASEFDAQNKELKKYYDQFDTSYSNAIFLCYQYIYKYLN